jgi:hypothetical protein
MGIVMQKRRLGDELTGKLPAAGNFASTLSFLYYRNHE